jgi:hypothetical protein
MVVGRGGGGVLQEEQAKIIKYGIKLLDGWRSKEE